MPTVLRRLVEVDGNHVDVLSSDQSLHELVNVQQGLVDEDTVLRNAGFPQSLIWIFRAANLTYAEIGRLPVPYSFAQAGEGTGSGIASSYSRQLRDCGVPLQCLPQDLRSEATPSRYSLPSRREVDFEGFTSLRQQQSRLPRTSPRQQQHGLDFQQRFGSPIRPMPSLNVPPTPSSSVRRRLGGSDIPSLVRNVRSTPCPELSP